MGKTKYYYYINCTWTWHVMILISTWTTFLFLFLNEHNAMHNGIRWFHYEPKPIVHCALGMYKLRTIVGIFSHARAHNIQCGGYVKCNSSLLILDWHNISLTDIKFHGLTSHCLKINSFLLRTRTIGSQARASTTVILRHWLYMLGKS